MGVHVESRHRIVAFRNYVVVLSNGSVPAQARNLGQRRSIIFKSALMGPTAQAASSTQAARFDLERPLARPAPIAERAAADRRVTVDSF